MRVLWLVACLVAACVQPHHVQCSDGRICPPERACDDVHGLCVLPGQLTACEGAADGMDCTLPAGGTGQCDANVCIEQVCGDGLVTGGEDCDGETTATCTQLGYYDAVPLTCTERCKFDETVCTGTCGDGMVNGPPGDEFCDGAPPPNSCVDFGFDAGRLVCGSFCAPTFGDCRKLGTTPVFQTNGAYMTAVFVAAPGHVFFGEPGYVVEVIGSTVKRTAMPGMTPYAIWGTSATDVHAAGSYSEIWHYDGSTWTRTRQREVALVANLHGIWASSPTDAYAVGIGGRILHYNGSAWSGTDGGPGLNAIWGASATNIRAVGALGTIRRYTGTWTSEDASACWSPDSAPTFYGIWGSSATDVFVVGGGTGSTPIICRFNGVSWTKQPVPGGTQGSLIAVWGRAANDVFAYGYNGVVLHYDGESWRRLTLDVSPYATGISGKGNEVVFAGAYGGADRYTGAAHLVGDSRNWSGFKMIAAPHPDMEYVLDRTSLYRRNRQAYPEVRPAEESWSTMWVDPSGVVFACDTNYYDTQGSMPQLHRFDGVSMWTMTDMPLVANGMSGRNTNDVFAVGGYGTIARYTGSWAVMRTGMSTEELRDVAATPTSAFAVGVRYQGQTSAGMILRYDGAMWGEMTIPPSPPLSAVYAASATDVFAVGDDGTILHFDGATWTAMASGVGNRLNDIGGTSGTDVFAVGAAGLVLHYDGVGWSPVRTPSTLEYTTLSVRPDFILFSGELTPIDGILRDAAW